ncbi:hypothetical protein ACNI3Q_00175 [Sphingomonas sp. FW199]|uniref:hypothetical protein n=1 Tax=Sphingomonas sp. FW199 TaxID=3400217 RepID=UPI003CF07788
MQPSSALCRDQAARHHAHANTATLENVRVIANVAALAWDKEGVAAGIREARKLRTLALANALAIGVEPPPADVRALSENPDRGHFDGH